LLALADDLVFAVRLSRADDILYAARLRCATSTAYYALFNAIAAEAANLLAIPGSSEWARVYRSLNHGQCKNACLGMANKSKLPQAIRDCASIFTSLQQARQSADYDPSWVPDLPGVVAHVTAAEKAITGLAAATEPERRAFVLCLLFQERN